MLDKKAEQARMRAWAKTRPIGYGHVHFIPIAEKAKTSVWSCRSNRSDDELGQVKWYGPWRQYCYFPVWDAIYSASCLDDISDFIQKRMVEHKRAAERDAR